MCIVLLCVSSIFAWGQSTKPGSGLSDTLTPSPTPISTTGENPDHYFGTWSTLATSAANPAPYESFPNFDSLDTKKTIPLSEANLYVIHITDWEEDTEDKDADPKIDFLTSGWYVYRYAGEGRGFKIVKPNNESLPPIYGMTNAVLLSVSRISVVAGSKTEAPFIQYSAIPTERTASNIAAVEALGNAVLSITSSGAGGSEVKLGVQPAPRHYNYRVLALPVSAKVLHAPFDVTFTATATETATAKPANSRDDRNSNPAGPALDANPSSKDKNPQGSGGASASAPAKTADCSPLTDNGKCYFSRTFTVDSRQYWNVGINIVVRGPRENKYALSSSNVVTQTHTLHAPLVASFDLSPWAYKLPMDKYPFIQVGVPLSGAAFHMPYFGLAQPLSFTSKWLAVSAYGGVVLMKQSFPKTIKVGQTTTTAAFNSDLETDWPVKAVYGIEVPVSSIVGKVKSSVGAGK